jgi:hypothetical protein
MALSQLVYQMGVNLDEFSEFLKLINAGESAVAPTSSGAETSSGARIVSGMGMSAGPAAESSVADSLAPAAFSGEDTEYWKNVQQSLIQSQWARVYRARAVSVIAMLDPQYTDDPVVAERRVSATLRPAVAHRHRRQSARRSVAVSSQGRRAEVGRKVRRARGKRRV